MRVLRALALAFAMAWLVALLLMSPGERRASDFAALYAGGALVATGEGYRLYEPDRQRAAEEAALGPVRFAVGLLPFVYPPFLAAAMVPLSRLPFMAAYWVWQLLSAVAVLGALRLLLRPTDWPPARARAAMLLVAGAFPLYAQFHAAQLSGVLFLALAAGTVALRSRRDALAGVILAGLLVKPQLLPVLVLGLLVWQRWRALIAFTGAAAGLGLVSSWIAGWGWWEPMSALAVHFDTGRAALGEGWVAAVAAWRLPAGPAVVLSLAAIAGVVGVTLWRPGLWQPTGPGWAERLAGVELAALFASPHLLSHDLLLAVVPGLLLWQARAGQPQRLRVLAGWAVAINIAVLVDALGYPVRLVPLLLGAGLVALAEARRRRRASEPAARAA